jgi:hypothetical protein
VVRTILVRGTRELAVRLSAWKELARNACEPNVFYEPEFLLPCLQELGAAQAQDFCVVLTVTLLATTGGVAAERLIGLFPFRHARMHRLVRLPVLKGLANGWLPHVYLGTPLVHREHTAAALDGLLDLLDRRPGGCALLEWNGHAADGPFACCLAERLRERRQPRLALPGPDRAFFRRAPPAADAKPPISGDTRSRLGNKLRNLERQGRVGFERLDPGEPLEGWIAEFLALEASGWKGKAGSALASRPADRRFFERLCRLLHAEDRLMMHRLTLDGRAVAANCMLVAADRTQAFSFKVAYDERLAKFSPGIQLKLHVLGERQRSDDGVTGIDSCAASDSPLWNTFHLDRRYLGHVLVGAHRPDVRAALGLAEGALAVQQRWQRQLGWTHARPVHPGPA